MEKIVKKALRKKGIFPILLFCILTFSIWNDAMADSNLSTGNSGVRITILYDNNEYDKNLKDDWGFSCLIQKGAENLLFDTGASSAILLDNIQKAGVSGVDVQHIFLSHAHKDHIGGLKGAIQKYPKATLYLPSTFPQKFKSAVKKTGIRLEEIRASQKIGNAFYTTGETGFGVVEQSLFFETPKGLVVVTGCAHPGIVDIIEKVKKKSKSPVYLAMGGFHLKELRDFEIMQVITSLRSLGVQKVAPCHCTGARAMQLFQKEYGDNYLKCGLGSVIDIN